MSGDWASSERKSCSATTRARIGELAVTVAVRGMCETSAISPKKSPAPSWATFSPSRTTSADPSIEDDELVTSLALARQHLALGEVDLVRQPGNRGQLGLGAMTEERNLLDRLDLLVVTESHRAGRVYRAAAREQSDRPNGS